MPQPQSVDVASRFLDEHERKRQVNRILHSFPTPRLWRETEVPVEEILDERADWSASNPSLFSLYVGVPYCIKTDPGRCGYCLFPVEELRGAGQFDRYLDYLEAEGRMYADAFESVIPESIYIGGGTPNLMRPVQYSRMMEIVRGVFPQLDPGSGITLEGIPQAFTLEKLEHMKAGGINRISMGVQQMNSDLNQLSGRKQTSKHVTDAIRWCRELDLKCNADLIFGWPRQTLGTMLADLEALVATGVDHITHYELNVGGPTDFALNRRNELPTPEQNLEMYRASRDFLTSNGYRQLTLYDFEKEGEGYRYEECWRDFQRHEMWGWGFAGVTDFGGTPARPGWTYVNHRKVSSYFQALDDGRWPVERGFRREPIDRRLDALFHNLQGMRIDRAGHRERYEVDLFEESKAEWTALEVRGWAEIHPDHIQLVGDGVYYVPLIQALLSRERVETLQEQAFAETSSLS